MFEQYVCPDCGKLHNDQGWVGPIAVHAPVVPCFSCQPSMPHPTRGVAFARSGALWRGRALRASGLWLILVAIWGAIDVRDLQADQPVARSSAEAGLISIDGELPSGFSIFANWLHAEEFHFALLLPVGTSIKCEGNVLTIMNNELQQQIAIELHPGEASGALARAFVESHPIERSGSLKNVNGVHMQYVRCEQAPSGLSQFWSFNTDRGAASVHFEAPDVECEMFCIAMIDTIRVLDDDYSFPITHKPIKPNLLEGDREYPWRYEVGFTDENGKYSGLMLHLSESTGQVVARLTGMSGAAYGRNLTYYPSGAAFSATNVINSKPFGLKRTYFESGQLLSSTPHDSRGLRHGTRRAYLRNGKLVGTHEYVDGIPHGEHKLFSPFTGELIGIEMFEDGKPTTQNTFRELTYREFQTLESDTVDVSKMWPRSERRPKQKALLLSDN